MPEPLPDNAAMRDMLELRNRQIAEEREPRPRHADDHVEFIRLQPLHKADSFAGVIESALLYRWCYEWIASLLADKSFHFLGATAFQTKNTKACEWH